MTVVDKKYLLEIKNMRIRILKNPVVALENKVEGILQKIKKKDQMREDRRDN